ncbi:hypothetical protein [Azotobacter chroococcum]|uniref:Uncharacterized protein n=1 Tax=Azotobacter chroococcum TaxID=353 RepID=A0AAP9YHI4_9GAMM|nr:hypothetical protein [Azotobacter chroococcum]QQE90610.1 hypothetical protein GKQ51_10265 [Azotobacter chroococcum]
MAGTARIVVFEICHTSSYDIDRLSAGQDTFVNAAWRALLSNVLVDGVLWLLCASQSASVGQHCTGIAGRLCAIVVVCSGKGRLGQGFVNAVV